MAVLLPSRTTMNTKDTDFFKALGSRIARARKGQGVTQQQLADQLGIAQQTLADYEVGRLRLPASVLPALGQTLGLSPEELLGYNVRPTVKRGPSPKLQQQFERISQLPKATQQVLSKMLDGVLAQAGH